MHQRSEMLPSKKKVITKDKGKEKVTADQGKETGYKNRLFTSLTDKIHRNDFLSAKERLAFDEFALTAGPRNKALAVWDLQYIIHACLYRGVGEQLKFYKKPITNLPDDGNTASSSHEEAHLMVDVYGEHFDLTSILKTCPDFSQLYLLPQHLNTYAEYFSESIVIRSLVTFMSELDRLDKIVKKTNLHAAEKIAVYNWTTEYYENIQILLRDHNYPADQVEDVQWLLATIAVVSCGLNHSTGDIKTCITESKRKEWFNETLFNERKDNYINKKPTVSHGFTASSVHNKFFLSQGLFNKDKKNKIIITLKQPKSLHPALVYIAAHSKNPQEQEMLANANQQFVYISTPPRKKHPKNPEETQKEDFWLAIPVRSIDTVSEHIYQPTRTKKGMERVRKVSNRLMLASILHPLNMYLAKLDGKNKNDAETITNVITIINDAISKLNAHDASINEKKIIKNAIISIKDSLTNVTKKTSQLLLQTMTTLKEVKRQLRVLPLVFKEENSKDSSMCAHLRLR